MPNAVRSTTTCKSSWRRRFRFYRRWAASRHPGIRRASTSIQRQRCSHHSVGTTSSSGSSCSDQLHRPAGSRRDSTAAIHQYRDLRDDGVSAGWTGGRARPAWARAPHPKRSCAHLNQAYGLDKPWYVQYFYWLRELVLHGSLGTSYVDNRPVIEKVFEKLPVTIEMVGLALILTPGSMRSRSASTPAPTAIRFSTMPDIDQSASSSTACRCSGSRLF